MAGNHFEPKHTNFSDFGGSCLSLVFQRSLVVGRIGTKRDEHVERPVDPGTSGVGF